MSSPVPSFAVVPGIEANGHGLYCGRLFQTWERIVLMESRRKFLYAPAAGIGYVDVTPTTNRDICGT